MGARGLLRLRDVLPSLARSQPEDLSDRSALRLVHRHVRLVRPAAPAGDVTTQAPPTRTQFHVETPLTRLLVVAARPRRIPAARRANARTLRGTLPMEAAVARPVLARGACCPRRWATSRRPCCGCRTQRYDVLLAAFQHVGQRVSTRGSS